MKPIGRTTQMLIDAIMAVSWDKAVVMVAAANDGEVQRLFRQTMKMTERIGARAEETNKHEIKIGNGKVVFRTPHDPTWDWRTGRFAGVHLSTLIMIDDYTWETRR